mgnify:CR=1 FL=1
MSKTLRTVAVIAGAVALVATGVGALAGAGIIGSSGIVVGGAGVGLLGAAGATVGAGVVAGVSAATFATVGAIASLAATVASIGAQLTAKKPPARGSVNQVLIATDAPSPYLIGRTFTGGVLRHDVGYGATLKKVPNPYRAMVLLYSVAAPLQGLESPYFDYAPVTINSGGEAVGYYNQFLNFDYRVGNNPDSALIPHYAGTPGWSSAHKLSSKACALWNLKFDKDGKRFASGVPSMGAVWNGVKVYDPRLDSTYPGGSGSHRIDNEATWTFSENPGLHGLAYGLGRYRNGKKVFGVGLPGEGIRIADFVMLANVCDANGWKVGGVIYEPGDRWTNIKEILQAGGAEPLFTGGKLGCKVNAPRVSLDTITAVDLADDDAETTPMQSWRNRRNGIIPKYRSEAHKWEYVPSDLVSIPAYVTEDGEEKIEERQYNLVQQKNQAAQLAAYELVNGRELFPITLVCKPRLRKFGPGDMLTLNLPNDHGLANVDAVIVDRSIDPASMKVTLTFVSETAGKHDFALGRTGTAPPTPSLTSPEDRDNIAAEVGFGQDGAPGTDGAPGAPGADGAPLYTWIAYADNVDGSANFSNGSPGGRAFIGIAANKTSATESTNPADYQWSAYRGPANFGLVNFNANSIVGPNFVQKVGGGSGWNASAYSSESFTGSAQLSFTVQDNAHDIFVGLNTDPTTDASYASIDYAFWLRSDGQLASRINDADQIIHGPYSTTLPMQIIYDGKFVRWYHAGALLREVAVAANLRFYLDTSIEDEGGRINNLTWASAGRAGDNGTDGLPGTNGTNGTTLYSWVVFADHPSGLVNFTTGAPGGRAYIGRADNKTTSTESTNPADYTWSLYTGPPNFGLVAGDNMTVAGARLLKSGGAYAWDAQVYSSESYKGGAFLSWRPEIKDQMMLGLNTDPLTNASFDTIDVAIYLSPTGWDCRINNAVVYTHPSDWALGDTFAVHYTGSQYLFIKNGVVHHAASAGAGFSYWFDSSFTQQGLNATIITWAAAGATGSDGANGATGDTVIAIYRRQGIAPATPTGNLTPSGWSTSKPADDGTPLWRSDGRILSADGTTLVGAWSAPTIFEAQAINLAAQTIVVDSQNDTFGPIIRALDPSQAIAVTARIRVALTVGPRTQSITTEFRLVGAGSWTTLASNSETDASFVAVGAVGTITNSTGVSQTYEIRATTVMSSPNGDVQLERSYFRA